MDLISLGLSAAGVAVIPLGTLVKKSYNDAKRLTVLETNYRNVDEKLTDLKQEQQTQTAKLDRLIERFL